MTRCWEELRFPPLLELVLPGAEALLRSHACSSDRPKPWRFYSKAQANKNKKIKKYMFSCQGGQAR